MSKRTWRTDLALGIVIVAAVVGVIATLGFWQLAEQRGRHERTYKDAAAYDTSDPGQQRQTNCVSVSGSEATVCIANAPNSAADQHRTDQDLRAQQEMADWALGMFFVALASVATTIIGLIYVVLAYRLNAEATRAATKATSIAHRDLIERRKPQIQISAHRPKDTFYLLAEPQTRGVTLRVEVATDVPAEIRFMEVELRAAPHDEPPDVRTHPFDPRQRRQLFANITRTVRKDAPMDKVIVRPAGWTEGELAQLRSEAAFAYLYGYVDYSDPIGMEWRAGFCIRFRVPTGDTEASNALQFKHAQKPKGPNFDEPKEDLG